MRDWRGWAVADGDPHPRRRVGQRGRADNPRRHPQALAVADPRSGRARAFGTLKRSYGWRRVRHRGISRNGAYLHLLCTAMNLRRAERLLARKGTCARCTIAGHQSRPPTFSTCRGYASIIRPGAFRRCLPGPQVSRHRAVVASALDQGDPFHAFPADVRRIIYTTNTIEALLAKLRRAVRARRPLPARRCPAEAPVSRLEARRRGLEDARRRMDRRQT